MDGLEIETDEGDEIGLPYRKVTCDGTELGLSECSNSGAIDGKFEVFLGDWLG